MRIPLALLAAFALLAAPAAAQEVETEELFLKVPTTAGGRVHVEIVKPKGATNVPIILTYSPYNSLGEVPGMSVADDGLAGEYVPKGYARAVADVLGTRNSTGCWDYGGPREQQSGVELVNALAALEWSNGKVGMIGGSYDGTTANMVAVRGADVPGLAAIAPQAAISRWYGYAYHDGVRYLGNSQEPADEGIDTPLGFDFGITRTPPTRPDQADGETASDLATGRYNPCQAADHTQHGYDSTPDYDDFWLGRDYLKDAGNVRVPVLVTHGWQDYNVKQSEGLDFYTALGPATPFKKLFMWQGPHGTPGTDLYAAVLDRFFARTLKGERNGIEDEPAVVSYGRTGAAAKEEPHVDRAWPVPGTRGIALGLGTDVKRADEASNGQDFGSYTDLGNGSEELALQDPESEGNWLFYATPPLERDVRLAGSALLDVVALSTQGRGHLTPTLVDIDADGHATAISRGFLNLKYRNGLAKAEDVPDLQPIRARVRLSPQDQTVPAGHRIGVIVQSSNTVWAVPEQPGYQMAVKQGEDSRLILPVVGPAPDPALAGGEVAPLPDARPAAPFGPMPAARRGAPRPSLRLLARRLRGGRLRISGTGPSGALVRVRVVQRGRRAQVRRVRVRKGRYALTVRVARRGRLRVTVRTRHGGRTLTAARRLR